MTLGDILKTDLFLRADVIRMNGILIDKQVLQNKADKISDFEVCNLEIDVSNRIYPLMAYSYSQSCKTNLSPYTVLYIQVTNRDFLKELL